MMKRSSIYVWACIIAIVQLASFGESKDSNPGGDVTVDETDFGITITIINSGTCDVAGLPGRSTTVMNLFCSTNDGSGTKDAYKLQSTYQADNCTTVINATSSYACHEFVHHASAWFHVTSALMGLTFMAVALLIVICCVRKCRQCYRARKLRRQNKIQELTALLTASNTVPAQAQQTFVAPAGPFPPSATGFAPFQPQYFPMYPYVPNQPTLPAARVVNTASAPASSGDEQLARALQAQYNKMDV